VRNKATLLAAALAICVASAVALHASDRVAVYAKVDKVILEPSPGQPATIQVWGVFSVAQAGNPNDYQPAARGYLYYRLPSRVDLARREWTDLQSVAGTGEIVAFGSRWEGVPRVRLINDKPANPDPYTLNTGLTKVRGNNHYAPIRALLDFKQ
jgi:hypothetical protein